MDSWNLLSETEGFWVSAMNSGVNENIQLPAFRASKSVQEPCSSLTLLTDMKSKTHHPGKVCVCWSCGAHMEDRVGSS